MEDLKAMLTRTVKTFEEDVRRLDAKLDVLLKVPDMIAVENVPKTMAWAMDSGDKELWLSVWSDDIVYRVPQYGIEILGKEKLSEFGDASIFTREERRFSAITNIMVEVDGDIATGRDYYMHYGFPFDPETGEAMEDRAFSEGQHYYRFRRVNGAWKIATFDVYLNRRQEAGG